MTKGLQETPSAAIQRLLEVKAANSSPPQTIPKSLPLADIQVEPMVFQSRADARTNGLSVERVAEIARGLDGSNRDEPIHVWWSGLGWIVCEGHHRHAAYQLLKDRGGRNLRIPVVPHPDIPLEEAIGLAGLLNDREKIRISRADKLDNAWRMVCVGTGSIKVQSERAGVAQSTISNMRQVKATLLEQGCHLDWAIDAGWDESRQSANGRTERDFCGNALEEMAEELRKLNVTSIVKSPDIFARAIELVSAELPDRLIQSEPFWDALATTGRGLLEETEAEQANAVGQDIGDF